MQANYAFQRNLTADRNWSISYLNKFIAQLIALKCTTFLSLLFYPDSLSAALSLHSSGASEEETLNISSSIIIMSSDHVNSFHSLQQDHNMKVVAWPATEKHCSQQSWGSLSVLSSLWSSWRSLLNTRMVRTPWLG